ncbi:hypothetical protein D9758_008721 [Tetrapyrgos nigripes]|uniref:Uncharacterized protein n=1 Tax=Tetrapyrgos nigripes TaxID=182062 RepID=A0A8H5D3T7_9AGAR|nr:hypothetical protein D9758_008721 [Tetrapyrgos nigripes]
MSVLPILCVTMTAIYGTDSVFYLISSSKTQNAEYHPKSQHLRPFLPSYSPKSKTLIISGRALRLCDEYQVRSTGDGFMCAFPTTLDALWWCLHVQLKLLNEDWPLEILDCEDGKIIYDPKTNQLIPRGLCRHEYFHYGSPLCECSPVTHRMEYLGPVVNHTRLMVENATGGQILCSAEVMREIDAKVLGDEEDISESPPQALEAVRQIGITTFQGDGEGPELHSVLYPKDLAGRHQLVLEKVRA